MVTLCVVLDGAVWLLQVNDMLDGAVWLHCVLLHCR